MSHTPSPQGQPSAAPQPHPSAAPFAQPSATHYAPVAQPAPGAPMGAYPAQQPLAYAIQAPSAPLPALRPVSFGRRLKGGLLDHGPGMIFTLLGLIPLIIAEVMFFTRLGGEAPPSAHDMSAIMMWMMVGMVIIFVGSLISLVTTIWGRWIVGGETGQSWGRKWANTRLVDERTGQPIGIGMTVLRDFAHYADSFAFDIGYLAPLFTQKRQTFADMIMHTVVVDADEVPLLPKGQQPTV